MLRNPVFLVLLCLASVTFANKFANACCTQQYPQYASNTVSSANPWKIRAQVSKLILSGSTNITSLVSILKKLPIEYAIELLKSLKNMNQLVNNLKLAYCPYDVSATGEDPYSAADLPTTQAYLQIYMNLVNSSNQKQTSFNSRNIYVNFYKQFSKILAQNPKWTRFGMPMSFSALAAEDAFFKQSYTHQFNSQDACLNYGINSGQCTLFKQTSYLQTNIGPGQIQVTSGQVNSIPYLSRLSNKLPIQTVTTSGGIALDKYNSDDVSIYSSEFVDFINSVDFSANMYVPNGVNINTISNYGFAPGETIQSIWGRIVASVFGPYLYCRFDNLLPTLSTAFPTDCKTICP